MLNSEQNNYRITSFTNGNQDINGLSVQLDHIQNPRHRPLDELFTDHFMQGILKHMKGTGERSGRLKMMTIPLVRVLICQTPKSGVLEQGKRGLSLRLRADSLIISHCNRATEKKTIFQRCSVDLILSLKCDREQQLRARSISTNRRDVFYKAVPERIA